MNVAPCQATLARAVSAPGTGVHTARPVTLRLVPAPENHGIVFVRTDLPGAPEIPVCPESVRKDQMQRMTTLGRDDNGNAAVGMIEHLLSACAGLGVSNLRAELDSFECPIFDGSAMPYVRLLRESGIVRQSAPARSYDLSEPVVLRKEHCDMVAVPAGRPLYAFFAEFRHAGMADQQVSFDPETESYESAVAPARTFCFWKDIEGLLKAGLIKGGSTDNAIVLHEGAPVRVTPDHRPEADPAFEWRVENELARHKLLDMIGDLSVLGGRINAVVTARATGHAVHQEFVSLLADRISKEH